ncbi:MAG: hypothetical protein AB7Y46_03235 [Armatimonadota bacterium]
MHYPPRFTRLIIRLPENVLRFRDYGPVPRQEVYLKDLMVTYLPPAQAFRAE